MEVAVVGTGYVGLVAGVCIANLENSVTCIDKDGDKVETLKNGDCPLYEEKLPHLLEKNIEKGNIHFTSDLSLGIRNAEIVFIAVGTPQDGDGAADLSGVLRVAEEIGKNLSRDGVTVVCKSTVPVGTGDKIENKIDAHTDYQFDVVSNPEFLKEGTAVSDFQSPSRVVLGGDSRVTSKVAKLYKPLFQKSERILEVDRRSAELIKYASNAMLANKISFINEISQICDATGADVEDVRKGMSMDERIGPHFIYPGVGYGGSCFPKDVRALHSFAKDNDVVPRLIPQIDKVNENQKFYLLEKVRSSDIDPLENIAVWGLSFKPGTDDIREAPAIYNIRMLKDNDYNIRATDPEAIGNASAEFQSDDNVSFSEDKYEILENADALFLFTEWEEYRDPDFSKIEEKMRNPTIFDGRNIYDPEEVQDYGIEYYGVGRNVKRDK